MAELNTHEINYNESTYHVKELISLPDVMSFVRTVSSGCFSDIDSSYNPELKDFFVRTEVFNKYTDIELPEDATEAYAYVYENERLFRMILCHVCRPQFDSILEAIDKAIEYTIKTNVSEINTSMSELVAKVDNFEQQFSVLFSSIDKDDMAKILTMVTNYDETAIGMAKEAITKK